MTNQEKCTHVFVECFSVSPEMLNEKFTYQCVEDAFDIMMETDDSIDFSSYTLDIEKLKKYTVEI